MRISERLLLFLKKRITYLTNYIAYFPALLMDLCLLGTSTSVSFYSKVLNIPSNVFGSIAAFRMAFFVGLSIPFGRISDRIGRTQMLYVSCVLLALVNVLIPLFCKNAISLAIIYPIVGVSMALFWPTYEAWLAERSGGGTLLKRIRNFNIFWSTGIALGPFFAGYLFNEQKPFRAFYLSAFICIITFGSIAGQNKTSGESIQDIDDTPKESDQLRRVYLYIAWIANFSAWFTLSILRELGPKLTLEMGIPAKTFGKLMLISGVTQTAMFFFLGTPYPRRWRYKLTPLVIFQLVAMGAFLCIWAVTNIPLWGMAFAAIGVCTGFTYFCSIYYSLHGHIDKGNKSGFHEAILGSGAALGPFLGGFAAKFINVKSPYLLCAVFILLSIIGEIWIGRTKRQWGKTKVGLSSLGTK